MIDILWITAILLAALSQWYIIEVRKQVPSHLLWLLIRAVVFGGFLGWYLASGYMWYWASYYMLMTFAWLFPLLLNAFRGKPLGYMSAKGSVFDKLILKSIGASIYWWLGLVLMVMAIGLQLIYGTTEFSMIP